MSDDVDQDAPHGRGEDGKPLAPYGLRKDGKPRLSNRGRTAAAPGKKTSPNAKAAPAPGSKKAQKQGLLELADMILTPTAAAVTAPPIRRQLGDRRGDALAGSVMILGAFADQAADLAIAVAEDRPGLLSWMDRMDDKVTLIMGAKLVLGLGRALYGNWQNPDPKLAQAAAQIAPLRAAQFAASISDQYERYVEAGLIEDPVADELRDYQEHEGAQMAVEEMAGEFADAA